mgnify:CR=1 FL=1
MIELLLLRDPIRHGVKTTTFGDLLLDGEDWQNFTLEDEVREPPGGCPPGMDPAAWVASWKVKKQTAIPSGRYRLVLENSPKFGPDTLTIKEVPGYDLIRIHALNDDSETEGCPGVGQAKLVDPATDGGDLLRSKAALAALKAKVVPRLKAGEYGWIEVRNARP